MSQETDSFYRSAPINELRFSGDDKHTTLRASASIAKYGVLFLCIMAAAVVMLCIALAFISELTLFTPLAVIAVILMLLSTLPLIIAHHRVNAAKETLLYILKYSDKY